MTLRSHAGDTAAKQHGQETQTVAMQDGEETKSSTELCFVACLHAHCVCVYLCKYVGNLLVHLTQGNAIQCNVIGKVS